MKGTKLVKAYCRKSDQHFGMEVRQKGGKWVVANFMSITKEDAALIYPEVRQDTYVTDTNLLPCPNCGTRTVRGCACAPRNHSCSRGTGYHYDCLYCSNLEIDYSLPSPSAMRGRKTGDTITVGGQNMEVKLVTFSNVKWIKFDNISYHEPAPMYREPRVHVVTNEENIEFHGYNISAMDEGVYYTIGEQDNFVIECEVDTSTIMPHPGGHMYITMGILSANLTQSGGTFMLDGKTVASVGSRFRMKLSLTLGGHYEVEIDGRVCGSADRQSRGEVRITFGFKHDSHYCEMLSHAYVKGIKMLQAINRQ